MTIGQLLRYVETYGNPNGLVPQSPPPTAQEATRMIDPWNDKATESAAKASPNTWVEAHPHGAYDAGDIGGDIQVGSAWSRRFVAWLSSSQEWAVLMDSYYTCVDENTKQRFIQNQTEFILCEGFTHPGSTELRSVYFYNDLYDDEVDCTDAKARELAECVEVLDFEGPLDW